MCYLNRTYHVLTTRRRSRDAEDVQPPVSEPEQGEDLATGPHKTYAVGIGSTLCVGPLCDGPRLHLGRAGTPVAPLLRSSIDSLG